MKTIKATFFLWICMLLGMGFTARADNGRKVYFYGNVQNDLYRLLQREGFAISKYSTPEAAVKAAPRGAGVLILAGNYPQADPVNRITRQLLDEANKKSLRLY